MIRRVSNQTVDSVNSFRTAPRGRKGEENPRFPFTKDGSPFRGQYLGGGFREESDCGCRLRFCVGSLPSMSVFDFGRRFLGSSSVESLSACHGNHGENEKSGEPTPSPCGFGIGSPPFYFLPKSLRRSFTAASNAAFKLFSISRKTSFSSADCLSDFFFFFSWLIFARWCL